MGDYYRLSLWADLKDNEETRRFLDCQAFLLFRRGCCYYHDGGTFFEARHDDISKNIRLAITSHWKINHRDTFEAIFLPALAAVLDDIECHDQLVGILVDEIQGCELLWLEDGEIRLLDIDDYASAWRRTVYPAPEWRTTFIQERNVLKDGGP